MRRSIWSQFGFILAGVAIGAALMIGFGIVSVERPQPAIVAELRANEAAPISGSSGPPAMVIPTNSDSFLTPDEVNNISVYESRNRGVVNITTETVAYTLFFDPIPQEGSSGSGSIIDPKGYILTNNHVIRNAVRVFVTLASGSRFEAEIVGVDPENDLAVLKIDPGDQALTVIPLGTTEGLRVGQKVLAIGNPFSFDRTLTTGVISGLGRPIRAQTGTIINNMIQTDASINPGNSGGPLLDNQGNIIGVNTMIYTPTGGSVGVGFAVPVETAEEGVSTDVVCVCG